MLKVKRMGDKVQGIVLQGDRRNPEPVHFRVCLPFGDVDIARTSDDDYWVHIRVNRPKQGLPGHRLGRIRDARIDTQDKHGGEVDATVLADPALCHLAVRLGGDDA